MFESSKTMTKKQIHKENKLKIRIENKKKEKRQNRNKKLVR